MQVKPPARRRKTLGIKDFFAKKYSPSPVAAVQTTSNSGVLKSFEHFSPLSSGHIRLYRDLRNNVPVIDAAIGKLVRLVCAFNLTCTNKEIEEEMQSFFKNVQVGGNSRGIDTFISTYFDELLTCGTAVGEIIPTVSGSFGALYNTNLEDISLKRNENGFDIDICLNSIGNATPPRPDLIMMSVLNPTPSQLEGNSLLKGLPFVSSVLMKIYNTIGVNFERVGNVRYAVTYKPQNDALDKAYAKDRALQIANEWSKAMSSSGQVHDFVSVGDVQIRAIGADNQILDSEIPVRQMLEQIVSKTGLPPFMLGLTWSSTERMSAQQADILTSELEHYRKILEPVLLKIANTYLRMKGYLEEAQVEWEDICLQDAVETAKARLYNAQAEKLEKERDSDEEKL